MFICNMYTVIYKNYDINNWILILNVKYNNNIKYKYKYKNKYFCSIFK